VHMRDRVEYLTLRFPLCWAGRLCHSRSVAASRNPRRFLFSNGLRGPFRVRAFVLVRWPRRGSPRRCRIPR
jgi:hypothetical protein